MVDEHPPASIRTERLILRCYVPDDAPALKDAIDSSLEHLRAWMPWAMNEPSSLDVLTARLERFRDDFLRGADYTYGIFEPDNKRLLGGIGLHHESEPDALSIGYWIRAESTRCGFVTEAAEAITRAASEMSGVRTLVIYCDPANIRSAAVARRLGFRHVETRLAHTRTPLGAPRDSMVWVLNVGRKGPE
jgi:RimJ/RimL family protein N-acetyltransferase